jgi:16S rRNA (cytosine1402-N4)-methyltransferase
MHIPVLQKELIELLNPAQNENFIDGTINGGGHSRLILEKTSPGGKLLGIDWTHELIEELSVRFEEEGHGERVKLVADNFARLSEIVHENKFGPVHGILLDLGFSSWHLDKSGRGFSFMKNERLDMRFDKYNKLDAWTIINQWPEEEIGAAIRDYGQERFWRKISVNIVAERQLSPINTTHDLAAVIRKSVPSWYCQQRINESTKTFQALRIVVNRELSNLSRVLPQMIEVLAPEGRMAVISFHELEDRIVKQFLKGEESEGRIRLLTKKTVKASEDEIKINHRARSARLRVAQKINLNKNEN